MRLALVGLGNAAVRAHLPAIARLERAKVATLAAAADPDPARRTALAEHVPLTPTFADSEDLLKAVTPDVLIIAADPRFHRTLTVGALEHGAHVLCEKPLALTEADHSAVAEASARRPDLALVAVHQYRYSPQWHRIGRWARLASGLGIPYALDVEVQRSGTDPAAVSGWRAEAASGGMLADAGVHFLALAATIGEPLTGLNAVRQGDPAGHERVTATACMGSGALKIRLWRGAPRRHTRIELRGGGSAIVWSDRRAGINLGPIGLPRKRVDALSDREHVDALYASLYRDLATRLPDPSWRRRRTGESLSVGRALVALLERARTEAPA